MQRKKLFSSFLPIMILILHCQPINSATHLILNNKNQIEYKIPSPYYVTRPDHFYMFVKQITAMNNILLLKSKLDYDQSGNKLRSTNQDCLRIGNTNLSTKKRWLHNAILTLTYKGINIKKYLLEIKPVPRNEPPTCSDDFPFQMDMSYDHLLGIAQRRNMKGTPEMQIFTVYSLPDESIDVWSSRITEGLKQNSSSWILLHLASFYWRVVGNPNNEIECLRRALIYTPKKYYDVPLAALGTVLHKHNYIQDAEMVFRNAIEISPNTSILHFMLANAKAANENYQEAAKHYIDAINLQPEFTTAKKLLSAVKCEMNIIKLLDAKGFNSSTNPFKQLSTREALQEIRTTETSVIQNAMHESIQDINQKRFNSYKKHIKNGRKCTMDGEEIFICDIKLATTVANFKKFMFEEKQRSNYHYRTYESQLKLLDRTCSELATLDANIIINEPISLPILPVIKLITRDIHHLTTDQPPLCHIVTKLDYSMRTFEHLDGIINRKSLRKHNTKEFLMKWLYDIIYAPATINSASIERWLTYIMVQEETSWLVYDLAALYWIAEGNHSNAIECFRISLHFASNEHTSSPLIGLSYTLLLNEYVDDAITVANAAIQTSSDDQVIQYSGRSVLGLCLLAANQLSSAITQFKEALSSSYEDIYLKGLIKYINCKLKPLSTVDSNENFDKHRTVQYGDAKESYISTVQETDRQLKMQTQLLQELKKGEKKLQELIRKSKT